MVRGGHRVLLSGIGGDEFLGGVPTPMPELEDLLARGKFITLSRCLLAWALVQRRPWIHLFRDAAVGFLPVWWRRHPVNSWVDHRFARRRREALSSCVARWRLFGPLPSFQENVDAIEGISRQLACQNPTAPYPYEKRYPFLDRDLLEFLFAIPREQLVRPGQRRSLMRRALAGVVPEEILCRKRKAYVVRSPLTTAERQYSILSERTSRLELAALGAINSEAFLKSLNDARQGRDVPVSSLLRAAAVEEWLSALRARGLLEGYRISPPGALPVARDAPPDLIQV